MARLARFDQITSIMMVGCITGANLLDMHNNRICKLKLNHKFSAICRLSAVSTTTIAISSDEVEWLSK
jgi:hypothetical protein